MFLQLNTKKNRTKWAEITKNESFYSLMSPKIALVRYLESFIYKHKIFKWQKWLNSLIKRLLIVLFLFGRFFFPQIYTMCVPSYYFFLNIYFQTNIVKDIHYNNNMTRKNCEIMFIEYHRWLKKIKFVTVLMCLMLWIFSVRWEDTQDDCFIFIFKIFIIFFFVYFIIILT